MSEDQNKNATTVEGKVDSKEAKIAIPGNNNINMKFEKIGPQKISFAKKVDGILTVSDIVFKCTPPQFESMHCACGFCVAASCGGALYQCAFCYGCQKPDCFNVCIAGLLLNLTSCCCYGCAASCVVGCTMMDPECCLKKYKFDLEFVELESQ